MKTPIQTTRMTKTTTTLILISVGVVQSALVEGWNQRMRQQQLQLVPRKPELLIQYDTADADEYGRQRRRTGIIPFDTYY